MKRKEHISSRRAARMKPRKLILVMVEGKTEECYFNLLNDKLKASEVTVKCYQAEHSTPDAVIKSAMEFKAPRNLKYDQRWVVYDADVLTGKQIQRALEQARQGHLQSAISNPCFEYWLLLHHECCTPAFNSSDQCIGRLQERDTTYRKGTFNALASYLEASRIMTAITHAQRVMRDHRLAGNNDPHPHPSTTVHLLIEAILRERERVGQE